VEVVTNDPIPRRHNAIAEGWLSMRTIDQPSSSQSLKKMRAVVHQTYEMEHALDLEAMPPIKPLSEREILIMQLSALGYSNIEIAKIGEISDQTVKNHKTTVFRKLGLHPKRADTMKAVRRLVALGLIRFP
jgi:DNA-binding NarL/FixJ family response regulator